MIVLSEPKEGTKSGLVTLPRVLMDLLDGEASGGTVKVSRSKLLEFVLTQRYAPQLREKGYELEAMPHGDLMAIVPGSPEASPTEALQHG